MRAVFASAAISALVLPLPVGDRIVTDGGWVRNFPLGCALDRPDVELVVAFRYVPRYPHLGVESLVRLRRRLHPLPRGSAGARVHRRARRGGGARAARRADPPRRHDAAPDAGGDSAQHGAGGAARGGARECDPGARRAARRPRQDRAASTPGRAGGDERHAQSRSGSRAPRCRGASSGSPCAGRAARRASSRASVGSGSGPSDAKRALIARGYAAADAELRAHGVDPLEQAS